MSTDARLESHTARPWVAVARLVLIAAVAGAVIQFTWQNTRSRIAENVAAHTFAELDRVLPAGGYDNRPHLDSILLDTGSGRPLPVYRARLQGIPTAAVLTVVAADGYSGAITLLVAVGVDGRVIGVRAVEHRETPGIGDAIEEAKSRWIHTFDDRRPAARTDGLPGTTLALRRDGGDIDAITGATVTSGAVVRAVDRAVQYFNRNSDAIFAASPPDLANGTGTLPP